MGDWAGVEGGIVADHKERFTGYNRGKR